MDKCYSIMDGYIKVSVEIEEGVKTGILELNENHTHIKYYMTYDDLKILNQNISKIISRVELEEENKGLQTRIETIVLRYNNKTEYLLAFNQMEEMGYEFVDLPIDMDEDCLIGSVNGHFVNTEYSHVTGQRTEMQLKK